MKIKRLINKSKETRRKYKYYLSLGYSETAAKVLSVVTYGNDEVAYLVKHIGKKNVIDKLYSWLHERKEETPEDAIRAYYDEKYIRPRLEEEERHRKRRLCGKMARPSSPPPASSVNPCADVEILGSDICEDVLTGGESAACECDDSVMLDGGEPENYPEGTSSYPVQSPGPGVMACMGARVMKKCSPSPEIMEALSTDAYEPIEEKDAKNVFTAPTSTFRMTTSNASMGIVFNQIRSKRRVSMDQVRIEEVLNYFDYEAEVPTDKKFSISTELMEKKGNKKILFIDAQAANEKKEHQNIILLLDTSGSMCSNNEVTQEAIATVFSKLKAGDRISLITYSDEDHTWFKGFEIKDERSKEELMGIILGIEIDGCTFGSAGIKTAYAIGEKFYNPDWNNQVILITDGDLNFGITDKHGLKGLIEKKKKSNIFLSVIGTGLYNYKDDNLEVLAKHGNGTYCVVNNLDDVEESVNRRFIALTNIIAKDVKAQVEFNPRFVKSYRLLGYENRQLNHEDFKNDKVISEPYGSGGHGIALYELEMNEDENPETSSNLKYQKPMLTDSEELGTVAIRYKEPLSDTSSQIETAVYNTERSTQNVQLAYLLYCISEKLRGSDKLDEYDKQFLDGMIAGDFCKNLSSSNKEKLEMLLDALKYNAEWEEDLW